MDAELTSVATEEVPEATVTEDDETKGSTEATEAAATKQSESEYDKAQQAIDQERANARKARLRVSQLEEQNEQLSQQLGGLQEKVSGMEGQLQQDLSKKEMSDVLELDPDTTDVPDLVRAYQQAMQKVSTLEHKVEEKDLAVRKWIEQEETKKQTASAEKAREGTVEAIYTYCDKHYGAQYRNAAISLADELVATGDADKPHNEMQAVDLMTRCYKEVAAKQVKPKSTKTVATDTGLRGVSALDLEGSEEFKPGSTEDVLADMAKKMKAGKWQGSFTGSS